jgi:hypothetical protein
MFARAFKKSFEQWWMFYFLKGLYGYTDEELKEYTDYRPGTEDVEKVRSRWYKSLRHSPTPPDDENNNR